MSRFEISKRTVAINSTATVGRTLISLAIVVWIQSYLVNRIRAEEYKLIALIVPLGLYVPLITMTVGGGISRFVIDAYARGDLRRVTQITSTMAPFSLFAGLLVATVGGILTWNIQAVLNLDPVYVRDAQIMFLILVAKATSRACILPYTVGIEVKQKFAVMQLVGLGTEAIRIALICALIFGVSARALWVIVAAVPGYMIDDIVNFVYSRRLVPELKFKASEFRKELISPLMSFGGFTLVSRMSAIAREMLCPIFLTHHAPAHEVNAFKFGSIVETRFYPTVLGPMLSLQPALTGMHAIGQAERLKRTFLRMSRYLIWVFLLFGVPAMIFHDEIWQVWLRDRANSLSSGSIVFVLLFAKALFVFPQPVIAQIALAKARNGPMAIRAMIIELSTVALAYYLVRDRELGAIGVAAATFSVSAVLTPALHWTFGLQMTDTRFSEFFRECLAPGLMPALVAAPVCLAIRRWFPGSDLMTLLVGVAASFTVYAFVLLRYCVQPAEKADFAKILAARRARSRA